MVCLGTFDWGSPFERRDPAEEPAADDIRDFLAASERREVKMPFNVN